MTTGSGTRGKCPVCGRFIRLKNDGAVEMHKPTGSLAADGAPKENVRACPGSNQPPKD